MSEVEVQCQRLRLDVVLNRAPHGFTAGFHDRVSQPGVTTRFRYPVSLPGFPPRFNYTGASQQPLKSINFFSFRCGPI
jgi:hypothetical protein